MTKASASKKINYQELRTELDEVLLQLQDESISIDDSIGLYERGLEIVNELEQYLKDAENKIVEIKAKFNKDQK